MEILAQRIQEELETQNVGVGTCVVYEDELERLWPLDRENRQVRIEHFAKEFGFRLRFYKQGRCAIFGRESPR
jgi:hypothetical protein